MNECVGRAVDRGINYFDTAANYGKGNDERMLGEALRGRRDKVFLATKVGCVADSGGHRKVESLLRQFEDSLHRLQTDYVDLIQLHEAGQTIRCRSRRPCPTPDHWFATKKIMTF